MGFSGGSGGGGGYRYQALAAAYVGAHALARHPLNWIGSVEAVPVAVWAESGGAGDDLKVEFVSGADLEIQVKKGQKKNRKLWEALLRLAYGLKEDPSLRCILLVDTTASGTVRDELALDVRRLGQGRSDRLRPVGEELLDLLSDDGVEPEQQLMRRLSIVTTDLGDRSTGEGLALVLLARAVEKSEILSAWDALRQDGARLTEEGGRADLAHLWELLGSRGIRPVDPAALAVLEGRQREDHVPSLPRPFVGRGSVVDEISGRLAASGSRPAVAVHGLPGAGKTAVAAVIAEASRQSFPGGVLWASLGESPDPLRVLVSWGRAVGARDLADYQDPAAASARMRAVLRERRALVVLDDVWDAAHARPLDVVGPRGATLLTTRFRSVALDVAGPAGARDLAVLGTDEAVSLLEELAPSLRDKERSALRRLAEGLGRLPVLLRVVGRLLEERARLGLPAARLIDGMARGDGLMEEAVPADLSDVAGEAGASAPTVAAMFARSTDALKAGDRDRFARLAAFAPGLASFDLAAAGAVWGTEDDGVAEATMAALARTDLVEADGAGRFLLHPVVRMHARALLGVLPEPVADAARSAHAAHYLGTVRAAERLYSAGAEGRRVGTALFDTEWANVRAGRAWAAAAMRRGGPGVLGKAHRVLDYAELGGRWISTRADLQERALWAEDAIEAATLLEDGAEEATDDPPRERLEDRYKAVRAHQLYILAQARFNTGDPDGALSLLEESREIHGLLGNKRGEARSVGLAGAILQRKGEHEPAEERFRDALALLDEASAALEEGQDRGATEGAEDDLSAAREEQRQIVRDRAMVLGNFGSFLKNRGRREDAEVAITSAIANFRSIGEMGQVAIALDNLGGLRSELFGDAKGAIKIFRTARRIFSGLGWRHDEAVSRLAIGRELANAGEHEKAEEAARELLALCEELGDLSLRGWALDVLGDARLGMGDPAGAAEAYEEERSLARGAQDGKLEVMALEGLGDAALADGDPDRALSRFEEGVKAAQGIPIPFMAGPVLFGKARALDALDRQEEAIEAAEGAVQSRKDLRAPQVPGVQEWLSERREVPPDADPPVSPGPG